MVVFDPFMESTEQIISVLFSVWGKEDGFMRRGREGMLILTNKRVAFVSKTKMNLQWWRDEVNRQLAAFLRNPNTIRIVDEYTLQRLLRDLEEEKNMNIPIREVVGVDIEDKKWGTELQLKFNKDGKAKTYRFAIVKGWVGYPVKDPIAFFNADWKPWVNALKSYM